MNDGKPRVLRGRKGFFRQVYAVHATIKEAVPCPRAEDAGTGNHLEERIRRTVEEGRPPSSFTNPGFLRSSKCPGPAWAWHSHG